jgi:hypothetical protein
MKKNSMKISLLGLDKYLYMFFIIGLNLQNKRQKFIHLVSKNSKLVIKYNFIIISNDKRVRVIIINELSLREHIFIPFPKNQPFQ